MVLAGTFCKQFERLVRDEERKSYTLFLFFYFRKSIAGKLVAEEIGFFMTTNVIDNSYCKL